MDEIDFNIEEPAAEEFDAEEMEKGVPPDDSMKMYLKEIGAYPLLTAEEEKELFVQLAQGSPEAKEKLVQSNLRLVVAMAKKYYSPNSSLQLSDLIAEGNLGLMQAVDKFDYTKGFKFSTYSTWWIKQKISRAIADQSRTIRIPVHMQESIHKVNRAVRLLSQELGRDPSAEELAEELGTTAEKVANIRNITKDPISLDNPVGDREDSFFGDFIPDESVAGPEESAEGNLLKDYLAESMQQVLTERERHVLFLRYGIGTDRAYSLEEIGKELHVTRERIRQIEVKSLQKLRRNAAVKELKEYVTGN